jgi:hypothetical protein
MLNALHIFNWNELRIEVLTKNIRSFSITLIYHLEFELGLKVWRLESFLLDFYVRGDTHSDGIIFFDLL